MESTHLGAVSCRDKKHTFLSTGDNICLYCTDTGGYVFCDRTCSAQNQLYTYNGQDRAKPENIPNPQIVAFQVRIQSRYKLGKKYRRLLEEYGNSADEEAQAILEEAKLSAEAEHQDNVIEQNRLHGKPLLYGAIIQLRHVFTEKYIHVDNTRTSSTDKSRLLVHLQAYEGKSAQFRLLPRYKVNVEGEEVRYGDQVILESVKTPGQYLHASPPFTFGQRGLCSEINIGVDPSAYDIVQRFSPATPQFTQNGLWGGAVVQLQHRHLEGYLSAEGVFVRGVKENVHLRVRRADLLCPRTLYPPSSCSTLWQIEDERSILLGDRLRWEQRVRLRHLPTRHYLAVDPQQPQQVFLVASGTDPRTVFRFHAKNKEQGLIPDNCTGRLEAIMSGTWLHADKDDNFAHASDDWMKGTWKRVSVSNESLYMDAFQMQLSPFLLLCDYNYLSGMVPLLAEMAQPDNRDSAEFGSADDKFHSLMTALREIVDFLVTKVTERQNRRKLLREMQILELLVSLLHSIHTWPSRYQQKSIFEAIYNIFYHCIVGGTNDDSLYLAQHLDFFLSQIKLREGFGFYVTRMLVELIKDRREVVERITPRQIDSFISLLKKYEHHRYIQLLSALCVVDGLALPSNQSRICDRLIQKNKGSVIKMRVQSGDVLVSRRNSTEEVSLSYFLDLRRSSDFVDDAAFLEEQLILFQRLCYGRNQHCIDTITKDTETVTWDVVMTVIASVNISDDIKAQFLDLMIVLFIDVGENTTYYETLNNTFVYGEVGKSANDWIKHQVKYVEPETEKRVPELTSWMTSFFETNRYMVANMRERNILILAVVQMYKALLTFGFLNSETRISWSGYLFNFLNGTNDLPKKLRSHSKVKSPRVRAMKNEIDKMFKKNSDSNLIIQEYRNFLRFEQSDDNQILVDAKYAALEVLEVVLNIGFHYRVQKLVAVYKEVEASWEDPKARAKDVRIALLNESFAPTKSRWSFWDPVGELTKCLGKVFEPIFIGEDRIISSLTDLCQYKYPKLTLKAMKLIQHIYTRRSDIIASATDAKLLQTTDSLNIYKTCQTFLPLLHRLLAVKLYEDQMHLVSAILDKFKDCCMVAGDESKPDIIGQEVLVSHQILPLLMSILERCSSTIEATASQAEKSLVSNILHLLQLMAKGNPEVQRHLMDDLGTLLCLQVAAAQLAETLKEIFNKNAEGAWKITSEHVKTLVKMVALHQDRIPAFVEVLTRLVVVDEEGSLIRRSQNVVMKHFLEFYPTDAYVFEMPASSRRSILLVQEGHGILEYFINLLNLLVHSGQGTRGIIRSFCQNVFCLGELLTLLANPDICSNLKRPLVRYLSVIYLQVDEAQSDRHTQNMMHSSELWAFLDQLSSDVIFCLKEMERAGLQKAPIPESLPACYLPDRNASMDIMHCKLFYLTEAVFDFILEFFGVYTLDVDQYPEEEQTIVHLTGSLMVLCPMMAASIVQSKQYRTMIGAMQRLMYTVHYQHGDIETCIQSIEDERARAPDFKKTSMKKGGIAVTAMFRMQTSKSHEKDLHPLVRLPSMLDVEAMKEIRLNEMLQVFMRNANTIFVRPNTLNSQLNIKHPKLKYKAYASGQTGNRLPLDEFFQEHVNQFIIKSKDITVHFKKTDILFRQLRTSAQRAQVHDLDSVDIRCLQILRATLHNLIVILPVNWNLKSASKITKRLKMIRNLQDYYVSQGLVKIAFQLLNKQNTDMLVEVLSLLCCLLFNANSSVQDTSLQYFLSTREEVFFMVLIEQFHRSSTIIKERRAFQAMKRKQNRLVMTPDNDGDRQSLKSIAVSDMPAGVEPDLMFTSGENSGVMLMLAVLAMLCDGQHRGMQDYLRYQPDNLRSFNVVAEATHFLALLASNINDKNIELATQLLTTLNEMIQGNQENRVVSLNSKMVDYINSIIRNDYSDICSHTQVLTMFRATADLIYSLLEESGPEALKVAKEVAATIDVKALCRILSICHDAHTKGSWKPRRRRFTLKRSTKIAPEEDLHISKYENEKIRGTAMKFFIIISRVRDVAPDGGKRVTEAEANHMRSIEAYEHAVASIEVVKNNHLQKVYFPIPRKSQIRREVKDKLLWGIDRSSPTNKIRDFVRWSNVIIKGLIYHRKVLSNPVSMFISSQWMLWNYAIIFLSVVINVIMLVTWEAKVSMKDVPNNVATLPPAIQDTHADTPLLPEYELVVTILGGIHNAFAVLLMISYFLINNPKLPSFTNVKRFCSKLCNRNGNADSEEESRHSARHDGLRDVEDHLFTLKTVFVLVLVGTSFAGTITDGYFFSIHLLNIVNTNQLLQGVIKAVTQNGRSLIWVLVLGIIMLYIYALVGFAFFRASFPPGSYLYCDTLYECTVTLLRYGLVGDIDERLEVNRLQNSFISFLFMAIYQVTFFVFFTTIGLNIIFGIIVDTFSELRDLKWRAEKDMQETCFICSRQSYDFEHFSKGFRYHVKKEHNLWRYIHYFLYLTDTNPNEYTSLDAYVAEQLSKDQYDFFPLNRALSLANMDEEMGETKLDTVADDVSFLVKKQNEEADSRSLQLERYQNERWRESRMHELSLASGTSEGVRTKLRNRVRRSISRKRSSTTSGSKMVAGDTLLHESPRGSLRKVELSDVLQMYRASLENQQTSGCPTGRVGELQQPIVPEVGRQPFEAATEGTVQPEQTVGQPQEGIITLAPLVRAPQPPTNIESQITTTTTTSPPPPPPPEDLESTMQTVSDGQHIRTAADDTGDGAASGEHK